MKIKDITYSSEYVAELENKMEYLKEENAELKRKHFILECDVHYLEMYKEALKLAIMDGVAFGGCNFWKRCSSFWDEQELYDRSIYRNAPNIAKGVEEFYCSIVANTELEKNGVKEK